MNPAVQSPSSVPLMSPGTSQMKMAKALSDLRSQPSDIARYLFLRNLQRDNPTLFYMLLMANTEELLPFLYTPTVGQACQEYHLINEPYGLYLRATEKGQFLAKLRAFPLQTVRVVVVTDGERVLGLGDLGAGGMGISEGKSLLYTAAAGVPPHQILPICLDVGTNNVSLLQDERYKGLRQRRITGKAYNELVAELVAALRAWQSHVLLQWEDFGNNNAFHILEEYRDKICSFNDDIQGTACITLAGLLSALRATGRPLSDQRILFFGAGEAGTGIGELIAYALQRRHGLDREEARRRCWFMDSKGLVVASRLGQLQHHKVPFAHEGPHCQSLLQAVRQLRPTALVGVSTIPHAFDAEVLAAMAELNERPIVFPLSNPTSKSECTFQQAFEGTGGRCVFASGSPFPPLTANGRTYYPAQANNALVFPAVGHAASLVRCTSISDDVFLVAAEALAGMTSVEDVESGLLFPRFSVIKAISARLMAVVAHYMVSAGLGRCPDDFEAVMATAGVDPAAPVLHKWEVYVCTHMFNPTMPARL